MTYIKIQNRYYEKNGGKIVKATLTDDKYTVCGEYKVSKLANMKDSELDENTKINKANIISQLAQA